MILSAAETQQKPKCNGKCWVLPACPGQGAGNGVKIHVGIVVSEPRCACPVFVTKLDTKLHVLTCKKSELLKITPEVSRPYFIYGCYSCVTVEASFFPLLFSYPTTIIILKRDLLWLLKENVNYLTVKIYISHILNCLRECVLPSPWWEEAGSDPGHIWSWPLKALKSLSGWQGLS